MMKQVDIAQLFEVNRSMIRCICKTASADNYKAVFVEFSSVLLQRYYPNRTQKANCVNQLSENSVA